MFYSTKDTNIALAELVLTLFYSTEIIQVFHCSQSLSPYILRVQEMVRHALAVFLALCVLHMQMPLGFLAGGVSAL